MEPVNLLWLFLAGVFFANAVPHGVTGIGGRRFQSPFARPPGVGESSPIVNVLWLGAVLTGIGLAWHFARVRGGTA